MGETYPIKAEFRRLIDDLKPDLKPDLIEFAAHMEEMIGEYEHGTANASDLLPLDVYPVLNKAFDTDRAEGKKTLDDVALEIMKNYFYDLLQYMNNVE